MRAVRLPARVTIAARITVVAGVLASVVLVSGALLVRTALHTNQMAATRQLAEAQASQIIDATRQNVLLSGPFGSLPYELVRSDGVLVSSSPDLEQAEANGPVMPPPDEEASQTAGELWSASITAGPLAGQTVTAVSSTLRATSIPGHATGDIPGSPVVDVDLTAYRAYVFASRAAADQAVATVDPYLWTGVALAIALLAGTAAVTAKRSLRPVDEMRRAADTISGAPDGARLAVPGAEDELRSLALTLNAMLARIDEAAVRQRRFTADAAHELRSPITSLLTALEVARAHPGLVPVEATLSHVHGEARRLHDLADELLELAAAAPTRPSPSASPSDARRVLRDVVAEVRTRSPRLVVQLVDEVTADIPLPGLTDRELRRVLVNLLDNAVRHAHSRVEVELTVDVTAHLARIEVANDGAEIPDDDQARIFEPFVRLDESRSRDAGGAGLGLAIASEIVARAGGTLTVASSPARTAFTVSLATVKPGEERLPCP